MRLSLPVKFAYLAVPSFLEREPLARPDQDRRSPLLTQSRLSPIGQKHRGFLSSGQFLFRRRGLCDQVRKGGAGFFSCQLWGLELPWKVVLGDGRLERKERDRGRIRWGKSNLEKAMNIITTNTHCAPSHFITSIPHTMLTWSV